MPLDRRAKDAKFGRTMRVLRSILNLVFAAALAGLPASLAAQEDPRLAELLARLADPDTSNWQIVEQEIVQRWSISGSATADLLLNRGLMAMEAGDFERAIIHLTALTDHAPEFAEGWNARATAYYQAGQFGPSIYDIQQVLALNPVHFGAMIGLGIMLEDMGDEAGALAAFRAAHAIHPHRPDIEGAIARLVAAQEGMAL